MSTSQTKCINCLDQQFFSPIVCLIPIFGQYLHFVRKICWAPKLQCNFHLNWFCTNYIRRTKFEAFNHQMICCSGCSGCAPGWHFWLTHPIHEVIHAGEIRPHADLVGFHRLVSTHHVKARRTPVSDILCSFSHVSSKCTICTNMYNFHKKLPNCQKKYAISRLNKDFSPQDKVCLHNHRNIKYDVTLVFVVVFIRKGFTW